MKKFIIAAAIAATCGATPVSANEARIEARGGVVWANGQEEAVTGIAAGYDFDLSDTVFVGAEGSVDKVFVDGTDVVFGTSLRAGVKLGENGKLYALAGFSFDEISAFHMGAGFQQALGERAFAKVEYRRYFEGFTNINNVSVGVGLRF